MIQHRIPHYCLSALKLLMVILRTTQPDRHLLLRILMEKLLRGVHTLGASTTSQVGFGSRICCLQQDFFGVIADFLVEFPLYESKINIHPLLRVIACIIAIATNLSKHLAHRALHNGGLLVALNVLLDILLVQLNRSLVLLLHIATLQKLLGTALLLLPIP